MGIHGLSKLIADTAPGVIKEQKFDNYFGRKIAIDASMHIYQFMVVVGRQGDQQLTNEAGEVTSHLQGMFNRTSRMLQAGIKPVYVFDGKPPQMKKDELVKRFEKREDATEALAAAKEAGDTEAIEKFGKRTVKVTKEHNEECMRLLRLMGVPIVEAPSEAEAQCTAMCKSGMVYGVATEDMDALTFGTPRLIRHLMAPASQAAVVNEIDVGAVLEGLGLTMEQFIDVCVLCGCDYCGTIRGIGAKTALKLIQKHGNIEKALASLDKGKYNVPDPFPYEEARRLFQAPEVVEPQNLPPLKWAACDEQGLVDFLVGEKNFSEDRIRSAVKKINAARGKASQGRLESFFGPATVKPGKAKAAEKDAAAKKSAAAGKKGGKLGVKGGVTKKVGKK